MRIGILGPLEVTVDGRPVQIGGARLRVLLILLALEPNQMISAERLIDDLWEGRAPKAAPNALQSLVSRLRAAIGRDLIESRPGGYRLIMPRDAVDAHEFETRVPAARRAADPAVRAAGLREALALWRGRALSDAAGLPFAEGPAARLESLRHAALEERLAADLALGRHADLVPELQALAAADRLREPVTGLLMRALYAQGRQAEALEQYETAKRALADTLGVDPSPDLEAVYLAVLRQDPSLRPDTTAGEAATAPDGRQRPGERPSPDAGEDRPHRADPANGHETAQTGASGRGTAGNLRARLTSFIGRDADLRRVGDLLSGSRLVTLTGPGGAGKTRLSVEAGERLAAGTPDGAWLAELAPLVDPAEVPSAVLAALGLREMTLAAPGRMTAESVDPLERLASALSGKRLLLLLDNCEHLLDAAARLADRVLADCPGVRILATSREPLGITGETLVPVEPLEPPPHSAGPDEVMRYPAVRLFADRATAVSPGFAVTEENVAWIVQICRALDGIPLAIELAAARLRALTPGQVAVRLDDRFRLLSAGSRTALPRHQTLRAVVEWSWDLLDEPERALWRRLAVFPAAATLESIEEVCADPAGDGDVLDVLGMLDVLTALIDKSLVIVAGTDRDPRYRMLDTIRAYGLERLAQAGEQDRLRRAHAGHFLRLAEAAEPHFYRAEQLTWLSRLTAEYDNVHAALRWTITARDPALGVRFCAALGWYWFLHGQISDGADTLEEVLALPGVPENETTALAIVLGAMAALDNHRSPEQAGGWVTRAQAICAGLDRKPLHPVVRLATQTMTMYTEGWDESAFLGIETLLDDPDPWLRGVAYFIHGQFAHNFGRTQHLDSDLGKALEAFREAGDRWGLSFTLTSQAEVFGRQGEHRRAVALYEEALRLNAELGGGTAGLLHTRMRLANELDLIGERARAETLLNDAMHRVADRPQPAEELAALHYQLGEFARRSGDEAEAMRRLDRAAELTLDLLGPPQFRALVLCSRGQLDVAMGRPDEARATLDEALRGAVQAVDYPIVSYVLAGYAELARSEGDPERAAELLGSADGLRGARDLSQPDVIAVEAAVRGELGESAFTAAYERGHARLFNEILDIFGLPCPASGGSRPGMAHRAPHQNLGQNAQDTPP